LPSSTTDRLKKEKEVSMERSLIEGFLDSVYSAVPRGKRALRGWIRQRICL
jgi:hypothetical protein